MSRQLMPKSGAMAPYLVMNRDAAVAGVFSVDGEAGAIDLTTKYVQISAYNTKIGAIEQRLNTIDGQIVTINQSIGNLNTAVGANTTAISGKAAKGANNDITELNAITKAILISQGGTGAKTLADARINLGIDRVSQFPTETLLRAPATATYLTVGGSAWGVYDSIATAWKPLGIGQGGTGATTVADARGNLQINRIRQDPTLTHLFTQNSRYSMAVDNNGRWGGYDSTGGVYVPLNITEGGTGAKTAEQVRQNIGGQWEETQKFLNSEAILLRRPTATSNQWIAFYREDNTAAIRLGHEPNDQLATHSYNTDGTYRKKINQISANGDTSIFGSLSLDGAMSCTVATLKQTVYPSLELRALNRSAGSDVGARALIQIPPTVNSRPYLVQTDLSGSSTGQIINNFPSTGGVLAVQGTSGREYKKDISLADSNEAVARITSLELVNFVYKDDEKQRVRFGVIAEDAEKIAPQYIKHNQFPIPGTEIFDDEGNKIGEEYQDRPSVDTNPIVMDLLGCVQNLQKQIEELKARVALLEAK